MSSKRLTAYGIGTACAALTAGMLFAPAASSAEALNSAYAIAASGLVNIDPTPYVDDSNGAAEDSVANIGGPAAELVTVDALTASAGDGYASSRVANLQVLQGIVPDLGLGSPLVSADAIEASCEDAEGTSSLANAAVAGTPLDVSAPPNTAIEVPGVASVTLNKQVTNDDGSLTVTALSVDLLSSTQTLDIASATCAEESGDTTPPDDNNPPDDGDNGGDDGDGGSDEGSDNGSGPVADAPAPTPVEGHLDVTG